MRWVVLSACSPCINMALNYHSLCGREVHSNFQPLRRGGTFFFEKRCCSSYVDSYTYLFILTYVYISQNYSHTSIVYLATDLTTYPILNSYQHVTFLYIYRYKICSYTSISITICLDDVNSLCFDKSWRFFQDVSNVNSSKYIFLKSDTVKKIRLIIYRTYFTHAVLPHQKKKLRKLQAKQSCCIDSLKLYMKTVNGLFLQLVTTIHLISDRVKNLNPKLIFSFGLRY